MPILRRPPAATPEVGAFVGPSALTDLDMVGDGSPIAVLSLARLGARRGESGRCDPRDQYLSGSLSTESFLKY
jgi:hypothetical protein